MSNKKKDFIRTFVTYASALLTLSVLLTIVLFVLGNGIKLMDFKLLSRPYESKTYIGDLKQNNTKSYPLTVNLKEGIFYSVQWGLGLEDQEDVTGKNVVIVSYVHPNSQLNNLNHKGVSNETLQIKKGDVLIRVAFDDSPSALSSFGAERIKNILDSNTSFREIELQTPGGGIKGSLLSTLYLIGLTLLVALPIGIGTAIYLSEFAKNNRITKLIRTFIETLTGVPSIIYGLLGLALFVPMTMAITRATGPSLLSGSLTLSVILFPVIIRTTEESLKVVPDELRSASLSLGANKTQTIFKVVLPNAISGILTSVLLAIGRIIGESAALIFAVGTTIKDNVSILDKSTSLAVHIYALMSDEPANIELSTTIALIILIMVLVLNLLIKYISKRFTRKLGV